MTYRDPVPPTCPRCNLALDPGGRGTLKCPECAGAFASDDVLREMLAELAEVLAHPPELVYGPYAKPAALTCPRCIALMQPAELFTIPVDRCAAHGTWFDHEELGSALERALLVAEPVKESLSGAREAALVGGITLAEIAGIAWLIFLL